MVSGATDAGGDIVFRNVMAAALIAIGLIVLLAAEVMGTTVTPSRISTTDFNATGDLDVDGNATASRIKVTQDVRSGDSAGTIGFNDDRDLITWWDGDNAEYPSFVEDTKTEDTVVSNSSAEVNVFSPDVDKGSMAAGRVYELLVTGNFSTSSSSDFFTINMYIGGERFAQVNSTADNVDNGGIRAETTFTVREANADGVVQPYTTATFNNVNKDSPHREVDVNTSGSTRLNITVQWDEAQPENAVRISQALLRQES